MQLHEQRRLCVPCSFANVRKIASFARECCSGVLGDEDAVLVELAVVEAANNIVGHAYRDSEGWPVEAVARRSPEGIEFILADNGIGFDPSKVPHPKLEWSSLEEVPERGRGLFLMSRAMDEVRHFRREGVNVIFLRKSVPRSEGAPAADEPLPFILAGAADPFERALCEDAFHAESEESSAALLKALPQIASALSLQTDSESAFKGLAKAMRCACGAISCVLRLKEGGSLKLAGHDGDLPPELPKTISLKEGESIEREAFSKCGAAFSDSPDEGGRLFLCLPLTGIGRLLGAATLSFKSKEDLFFARDKFSADLANLVSAAAENHLLYSKALEAEKSEKEMETAANLHKGIISMFVPSVPGLSIYAKSQSALDVGGDYLTFHRSADNCLWFMICDAMGKGMAASFFSILSHMTFQSILFLHDDLDPGELLTLSNRILSRDFDRFEMFMTALVGKIDTDSKNLKYASAGHCPPILHARRPKGNRTELLDTQDYMLGVDSGIEYKTYSLPFLKGMKLVAYTDGLTDITGPDGEMLGVEPLLATCEGEFKKYGVTEACNRIFSDALEASGNKLQDDVTLLGIERL